MRLLRAAYRPSRLFSQRLLCASIAALTSPASFISRELWDDAKRRAVSEKWVETLPVEHFLHRGGLLQANGEDALQATVGSQPPPILDVRAPCEFAKGHLPGAINVPIFSDEERAEIGTLYKQQGHDVAVNRGLKLVERKGWDELLAPCPHVAAGDELLVYCFRGGMRSGSMARLLSQAPLRVHTMEGGYKAFRQWAITRWEHRRPLCVVGGPTGSGKTEVLLAMREALDAQVLDLEGEANHRGSIFGALGREPQPTNEMYENVLALQWAAFDTRRPVFVEDESHAVGRCGVPPGLWSRMRAEETAVLRLAIPHEARVEKLVGEYGVYPPAALADCVRGLAKRLGPEKAAELVALLEQEPPELAHVADELLTSYYDAMYAYQAKKRKDDQHGAPQHTVECDSGVAIDNARRLLTRYADLYNEGGC